MQTVQFVKNLFKPRYSILDQIPDARGGSYMDDVFDKMMSNPDPDLLSKSNFKVIPN